MEGQLEREESPVRKIYMNKNKNIQGERDKVRMALSMQRMTSITKAAGGRANSRLSKLLDRNKLIREISVNEEADGKDMVRLHYQLDTSL